MTGEDQRAYETACKTALKMVPRGHVLGHVIWRDGHLTPTWFPREHALPDPERPASRRGFAQGLLI